MQKFSRGQRVKIADNLPECVSHFESGVEAIIMYSYSDQYGGMTGHRDHEYSLFVLTDDPYSCAWYEEDQLTLIDSNRDAGEKILRQHKMDKQITEQKENYQAKVKEAMP